MTPSRPRWWPRSVRRQLVIGVSVIVCAAMIGGGAVAAAILRNEMISLTNTQVTHSLDAFSYSYGKAQLAAAQSRTLTDPVLEVNSFPGQAPGTVIAVLRGQRAVFAASFTGGEPGSVPDDVVRDLQAVNWPSGETRTVRLGESGEYRVGTRDVGSGERLVSAVSLVDANRTLASHALAVAVLVAVALVVAAAATVQLIRLALRPLQRVADVAGDVANLPLTAAEYRITSRVSDRDADPGSEVGVLGSSLNLLLDNVDAALTQRAETDRRVRQFLTDASHELRTPLAAILGYAELTRQDSAGLPPMTEYALERIESESRRMTALVSDLLLLSRLDERQDLHIEEVDLCGVVADAVNDAAVAGPEHRYVAELPDYPVWVRGDRARLQQVILNLLSNARMHTPPGVTVTTAVSMAGEPGRSTVVLEVRDNGPGIPEAIVPYLFGRFVRADKDRSREMGSSGLGLAIVASVVEAHQGTVSVRSRPGQTVFTVRLPAAPGS